LFPQLVIRSGWKAAQLETYLIISTKQLIYWNYRTHTTLTAWSTYAAET